MTKGRPPRQALKEAAEIARRQGELCENTKGPGLLYDFAIHLALVLIYVRVKRIRAEARTPDEILAACRQEILLVRRIPPTAGLVRELWVRTPKGTWRYFMVLEDRIVEIPRESTPEHARARPLRGDTPGPDRSGIVRSFPIRQERFVCPFTLPVPASPE